MTVLFHPEFPQDIRRHQSQYAKISPGLGARFRGEIDDAVAAISSLPQRAGHRLSANSPVAVEFRRRNLRAFPFFILYGMTDERVIIASIIPSRSDPLTWLTRLQP